MFTENVADFLSKQMGRDLFWVLAFGILYLGPLLLFASVKFLEGRGRPGGRDGLLLGFAAATWASLCWLVIPWAGAYPNLPSFFVMAALFGLGPVDTLPKELLIHAANFLIWPLLGWLVFRLSDKSRKPR